MLGCSRVVPGSGDTKIAVASSCDEPSWARECLTKFTVGGGIPLSDIVSPNLIEIVGFGAGRGADYGSTHLP